MATPTLDFWFDFASTYTYPAAMRIGPLAEQAGVTVRFRPFLLGPIFGAQGWNTSPFNLYPAKGQYMWRDIERLCSELSLPFQRPDPFPQNSLLAARVALAVRGHVHADDFCRAVFHAEFGEGRQIGDALVIGNILAASGIEPEPALAKAASNDVKALLRSETEEAQRIGIFGAPTFVAVDGEIFWGNDRLEAALRWTQLPR